MTLFIALCGSPPDSSRLSHYVPFAQASHTREDLNTCFLVQTLLQCHWSPDLREPLGYSSQKKKKKPKKETTHQPFLSMYCLTHCCTAWCPTLHCS